MEVILQLLLILDNLSSIQNNGSYYVDYIHVAPSTIGPEAAQDLADTRALIKANERIDVLRGGYSGTLNDIDAAVTTLEGNIEAEDPSASIIPNSTFFTTWEDTGTNYAKNWIATHSIHNNSQPAGRQPPGQKEEGGHKSQRRKNI